MNSHLFTFTAAVCALQMSAPAAQVTPTITDAAPGTYTNPVGDAPIHMGDPFAFWHEGKYYLIGTTAPNEGFHCYESTDLAHWQPKGWAWRKPADSWAVDAFWAPEVKFYRGKFYLTYSGLVRDSKPDKLLMGLAVSDAPAGPYRDLRAPWFDPGYSTIDGHLFVDDDGTPYLFFSRNGAQDGCSFGINYGVQLERDLSQPVGEPVKLLEASQSWERVKWAENRCNEGATVLKHNGRYYMTYSANHTAFPNYGVGYATADKPLGPWTKAAENPILATHLEVGVSAPGHNSIVRSPDGKELFIVYHTHADPRKPSQDRVVNIDRLEFTPDGKLRVKGPTRSPQPLPSGVAADAPGLRCEFMKTPLGIDDVRPALSWTIRDELRGVVQMAYDRKVGNFPAASLGACHRSLYEPIRTQPLFAMEGGTVLYQRGKVPEDWASPAFGATTWSQASVINGQDSKSISNIGVGDGPLHLRGSMSLRVMPRQMVMHTVATGDWELFINGPLVMNIRSSNGAGFVPYSTCLLPASALKLLREGDNTVALRVRFDKKCDPSKLDFALITLEE